MAQSNKISLKVTGRMDEGIAGGAVLPGKLIERNAADKLIVHNSAGGRHSRNYAEEDSLQGRTVDDAYALDERIFFRRALPGDVLNVFLQGGSSAVVIGTELVSGGDGTLIPAADLASPGVNLQTAAYALEALDLSASAGVPDAKVKVVIV